MREILFRGKRLDNGEWIYGFPLIDTAPCSLKTAGKCVCKHDGSDAQMFYWDDEYHEYESVNVIPETIGQYTGMTDKNGAKIFEGDIVKTKKYGRIIGHTTVNDFDVFQVRYEPCMFRLIKKNRGFNLVDDGFSKFEVIGNIHDNPELLKGGDEK